MYKNIINSIVLFTLVLLTGCSSGKKAFEQGNYYEAVIKSINRLRQNPDHKKSIETLDYSYQYAVEELEDQVRNEMASDSRFKWKNSLNAYQKINFMYEEIRRSPGALKVISTPKNYYNEVAEIKLKAAEESYKEGVVALALNTRESAKTAYAMFKEADEMSPGYKDSIEKMEESLFMATLKVIVEQIPVPGKYQLSGNFFQDKVESFLNEPQRFSPFVRFYTAAEAADLTIRDHYIRIQFDDFVVGESHTIQKEQQLSKDSVKVGEATGSDGTKIPVYNTVKAKLISYRKELSSKGLLSMRIVDAATGSVIKHEKFESEFVWFTEWGNFNGDERALDAEHKAIITKREMAPPPPQDLFFQFSQPLYDRLTNELARFYRNY